ncbi:MAG TPA: WD40 repeat domain-containing protein [Pirellulales bacterium]|nr:WD40 repeat domain-containing protein [Pirellulales bacterium]
MLARNSIWAILAALTSLAAGDMAAGAEPAAADAKSSAVEGGSQSEFGSVRVRELRTIAQPASLSKMLVGHRALVPAVAFLPDGKRLLSMSNDSHIRIWDLDAGACLRESWVEGGSDMLALSPNGKSLAVSTADGAVALLDLSDAAGPTKDFRRFEQAHSRRIAGLAFSPQGDLLASASHDGTSVVWEVKTGRELRRFEAHDGAAHGVCFSPDGRRILIAGNNKLVRICDVEQGFLVRACVGHEKEVLAAQASPDGRTILSGGFDNVLRQWNYSTGRESRRLAGHSAPVRAVAFLPDGTLAASASEDHTVRLWDLETGVELQKLESHKDYVLTVAFSSDGKWLASAGGGDVSHPADGSQGKWVPGDDYAVRVWRMPVFNKANGPR